MSVRCVAVVSCALLALCSARADAQANCRVSVVPLAFGDYYPVDRAPLDVTGSIDVSCRGRAGLFLATISTGSSGSYTNREMQSGPYTMRYNLYRDSARSLIWGDGTGGSVVNGRVKLRNGRQDFTLPVYGRIFPQQSVGAGIYVDDVIVTIVF
ncbi:MAG: spore coat U domain-containing protein [Gammaproteobacteria bacterium]|nr:spore coat U domain-containing protein [Gammaproteobacteria bacterium]